MAGYFCFSEPGSSYAQSSQNLIPSDTITTDSAKVENVAPYEPSKTPTFKESHRFGDPFSNRISPSPLLLTDPSSISLDVEYDSGFNYTVYEKIGDVHFRPMTTMTFQEYDKYNDGVIAKDYFQERSAGLDGESAVSSRDLIPRLYISPMFDRLFGGSYVDIRPNGFVNLDFGARFQRTDNPAIPLRQQRNGGFNFDQQISLNLVGKVGEKLAVTANFDNNNTFDFQNNMKVEYTGYDEDIVKKIEIGNVSMPVANSLMTGGQALFGVKTQLQFGKLYLTTVLSRQQGQNEVLTIESGFQGKEFEVPAAEYDENKHFFLGHFFRDNYEGWLRNLPQVVSGVNVTRVEVYVINRNNETQTTRQVVGFLDLGEGSKIQRPQSQYIGSGSGGPNRNGANTLFSSITGDPSLRNKDQVGTLLTDNYGFVESTDYVKVGTARKLDQTEYTINKQLGFISLLRKLQNDEMLAVSYEYTYDGRDYKVGELTEDYSGRSENEVIFLKLLRPNKVDTKSTSWDLMMKNIYYLNANQVERDGFTLRIQYRDDLSGIDNPSLHEGRNTTNIPLLELLGLDQLNRNNDRQRDGNFDYIENVTIEPRNGLVIFPVLEPFGRTLRSKFGNDEIGFIEKYVYDTLYRTTRTNAATIASKNKYFIVGKFNAGSSSEIALPGINIAQNSVVVTAGNTPLTEGLDYTVNYDLGTVRILNEGILNSGKTINISYEKADLFNFQARWLYGARADYKVSEKFNIGATILYLNERPGGISRYKIGDEPTRNTKYGFDLSYKEDVPLLTKLVDALPLVSTKENSSIAINAEFAQLIPGTSNIVDGEGTSYIDDFETAASEFSIAGWSEWHHSSIPETSDRRFFTTGSTLGSNFKRAKIAWYTVDASVFYRTFGFERPKNITEDDFRNNYERYVLPQEIFKNRDQNYIQTTENLFDIAYFPSERGIYNYNTSLTPDGFLQNPRENWGGITRAIKTDVDFQKTNMQYIEFWLMDPFISDETGKVLDGYFNTNNTTGGELVFNLGNVSEDLIPDGKHSFESGYPPDGDISKTTESDWGRTPVEPFLINRFQNTATALRNQDIGLDGLSNTDEQVKFANYLNQLPAGGLTTQAIRNDPSGDDFKYFLGDDFDAADAKVVQRYKNFNGIDGNTPPTNNSNQSRRNTNFPDNEDINVDNTVSTLEEYFEYKVSLKPGELEIGRNHIVDKVDGAPGSGSTWYLFRIPVLNPDRVYGNASINTVRFMRMYLTGFAQPVVLRMAKFQLVSSQWRKYTEALSEPGLNEIPENTYSDFTVSVVSIEDNGTGSNNKSPYVVPLQRDLDNTTLFNRRINERSLQICVEDLPDKDARAVYKNSDVDLLNYGRMKMFFHAESYAGDNVQDDEVSAFLRFGTDFVENYYEIEVPLKITPHYTDNYFPTVDEVWPLENQIDIEINEFLAVKSERNKTNFDNQVSFSKRSQNGQYKITVRGRPDMSAVRSFMIGVRNPQSNDQAPKSICLWANELRVTDFDKNAGWAGNARISTKLADVATINASTRYTSIGFGTIQQTVQQRTRAETLQYDLSANVNVDKFLLPHKTGLKVPMFVSLEKSTTTPKFDPLDPDTPLEASLQVFETDADRENYSRIVEERSTRRSINFTNVHKEKMNKEANKHFFDVENLSLSAAYSDTRTSNVTTQSYVQKTSSAGVAYVYAPEAFVLEPFAKGEALKSPYLKLIKDANLSLLPSNISVRADLNRNFRKNQYYNDDLEGIDPIYERLFTFTRAYGLRWNVTKNLGLDYSARANAIIDEPDSIIQGDINKDYEKQYILNEIKNLGRMRGFSQDIAGTYRLPLDKIPLTDWLSADVKYQVGYTWTAGSKGQEDDEGQFFGHTIQNSRDRGMNGKIDMVKLYNKVAYLKAINTPSRKSKDEVKPTPDKIILRSLMSLRSINMTYNIREGTTVSGFVKSPFLFGQDSSWNAPGWKFLLGSQDPDIRFKAAENDWLTKSRYLTSPFVQTETRDLGIRGSVEPGRDWKIQLDAKRTITSNYQEIFRNSFDSTTNTYAYRTLTPSRSGSYSISYNSINTAFVKNRSDNTNDNFDQFARNIEVIRARQRNANQFGEYDSLSQDVLIPAFLAAYSDKNAANIDLTPFPLIPIPSWRIDYSGLAKIPAFAEVFSSITLSHGYRSIYNVTNYTNSLRYTSNLTLNQDILNYPQATKLDENGRLIPVYIIQQVSIAEQFAPLFGINIKTKTNISTRIDYKRERNLLLNMSNAQVTETSGNDVTMDLGFTKSDFKLPFKVRGRTITLENDVTFRMAVTVRDTQTIQRKLEGENKITNGNTNFQFRPAFTYKLNNSLDLTGYFERSVNEPKVSSFKTSTTGFGVQLRFSLTQ